VVARGWLAEYSVGRLGGRGPPPGRAEKAAWGASFRARAAGAAATTAWVTGGAKLCPAGPGIFFFFAKSVPAGLGAATQDGKENWGAGRKRCGRGDTQGRSGLFRTGAAVKTTLGPLKGGITHGKWAGEEISLA